MHISLVVYLVLLFQMLMKKVCSLNKIASAICHRNMLRVYRILLGRWYHQGSGYNTQTIITLKRFEVKPLRWRNGLARLLQWLCCLQGPGFESRVRPVDFFLCNKVSPLNSQTQTPTSLHVVEFEKHAFYHDIILPQLTMSK